MALLHHVPVASREARAWMLVLHGIFGSGNNLRSFARKLSESRPDWGLCLVDLREHGSSVGAEPPHTMATAAADVVELASALTEAGSRVGALLGHSLGGKVATRAAALLGSSLEQLWVIDSSPSARPSAFDPPREVPRVLLALEEVAPGVASRDGFVSAMTDRGYSPQLAHWLAMNVRRDVDQSWRFALDLAAMRSLLESYYGDDVWQLYAQHRIAADVHVVVADRSTSIGADELARFAQLAAAGTGPFVHHMDTGHWVHAERPDELAALVARHLPAVGW